MELRKPFWVVVGSLAITSGVWAGEIRESVLPAAKTTLSANQKVAQEIAVGIARAVPDRGYCVNLEYQGGVATLRGVVSSPEQMLRVVKAVRTTASVERVVNELAVRESTPVRTAGYQETPSSSGEATANSAASPGMGQSLVPSNPQAVFPQGVAPQYDYPYVPPFAWPAHAPYPNYSAVQYPTCYPAKAWPYIGPLNPYPEPPLDWREVKLKWNDGHWYLRFSSPCACLAGCRLPISVGSTECGWELRFKKPWHTHPFPH